MLLFFAWSDAWRAASNSLCSHTYNLQIQAYNEKGLLDVSKALGKLIARLEAVSSSDFVREKIADLQKICGSILSATSLVGASVLRPITLHFDAEASSGLAVTSSQHSDVERAASREKYLRAKIDLWEQWINEAKAELNSLPVLNAEKPEDIKEN
jgi:hypothetical protein